MKFDFAIGNPPYQDITTGENDTFAPPVYNKFLDSAYQIADKVEMIHPARFLSNAGSTPKEWNKKMLDDEHLKILYYEQDSSKVFSNTDIKGGVTVTYRDLTKNYGAIEVFSPYDELRSINSKVSEIIKDELQQGIEIDGETEEYAFDLNEFFAVTNGKFNHESSVDKFLDALTRQTKFPFSTEELRDELKHTFWLLDRVDSAKALAKKLREHPIFQEYEVVLAAGDGKLDDDEETMKSYDKVVAAIAQHEKTITLSVGQLTTGITIPEWTAVLMLSNMRSPALYMQAAFRAQNPCLFKVGTSFKRKENAYVFDFDPARTLTIFEQFANNLKISVLPSSRQDMKPEKHQSRLIKNLSRSRKWLWRNSMRN